MTFEPSPELTGELKELRDANRRQADTIRHLTAERERGVQGLRDESDRYFGERNEARRKLADIRVLVGDLLMTSRHHYHDGNLQASWLQVNAGLLGQLTQIVARKESPVMTWVDEWDHENNRPKAAQGEGRPAALPCDLGLARQLAGVRNELGDVQAECCRLTDVNGDLTAELARAREAATCVLGNAKLYPLEISYQEAWSAVPSYLLGDLERAITGEAKPEPAEADVIDPKFDAACGDDDKAYIDYLWSLIDRLQAEKRQAEGRAIDPGQIPIDKEWFFKFSETMNAVADDNPEGVINFVKIDRLVAIWNEGNEDFIPAADRPEPARESVNARLLAAAKAVEESAYKSLDDYSRYEVDWTGVDDDVLAELTEAIEVAEAAQEEAKDEAAERADATIVSMSAEMHEMRERLKELADLGRTVVDGWRDNGVRGKEYIERINALAEMLDSLPK